MTHDADQASDYRVAGKHPAPGAVLMGDVLEHLQGEMLQANAVYEQSEMPVIGEQLYIIIYLLFIFLLLNM